MSDERPDVQAVLGRSALMVSATRVVPLPLLDDILADKARQHMTRSLLKAHGREFSSSELKPLWVGESLGCLLGCLVLPFKLLLWPIKKLFKTIFFIFTIREVALEVARTLLLGRAMDQWLVDGKFTAPKGPGEATRHRAAFDVAFEAADNSVLIDAMIVTLKKLGELGLLGFSSLKGMIGKDSEPDLDALPEAEREQANTVMQQLMAVLEEERVVAFLADFDSRLNTALS